MRGRTPILDQRSGHSQVTTSNGDHERRLSLLYIEKEPTLIT